MSDLPRNLRRLREDPLDVVLRLAEFGARRATSVGEARAAAHLDGRLRRAGLRVSVDSFQTLHPPGWDGLLLGGLALLCAAFAFVLPVGALVCALACLLLAGVGIWRAGRPLIGQRGDSQNVIGTRAAVSSPRYRVVMLVPLDSPLVMGPLVRWLTDGPRLQIARLIGAGTLTLFALAPLLDPQTEWQYALWLPVVYLLVLAASEGQLLRAPASPGAVSHSGALATLIAAVESLPALDGVELWTIGLGATANGDGLTDFLRRYPFERATTLFLTLEGIGVGTLSYLTRHGLFLHHTADGTLLRLADAADAADPLIDAEPRSVRLHPTTTAAILRPPRRTLTITCLTPDGHVPYRASRDDTPEIVAGAVLERAVRLVNGLLKQIDGS